MNEIKDYPPYLDYPKPQKPKLYYDKVKAMDIDEFCDWYWEMLDKLKWYTDSRCALKDYLRREITDIP